MEEPARHRIGQPSPLIFNLNVALAAYMHALMAAPRAGSARFPWAECLSEDAARIGADLDQFEIACEMSQRLRASVAGIEIWQRHPYIRSLETPPAIWSAGCSRLIDYGRCPEARDADGAPVLIVPSLINRAYILDLAPRRSLLRWMAGRGFRPLLLDWGEPGAEERAFGLAEYGAHRLGPALSHAAALAGGPVPVIGYCMGGTLAAGLAARRPGEVSRLVTIGAPWDFGSTEGIAGTLRAMIRAEGGERVRGLLRSMSDAFGFVPVGVFQMLFSLINPMNAALKFQKLAALDPGGRAAQFFVALEDWLADGVPMPGPAAQELLVDWQVENRTAREEWRLLGGTVRPADIAAPALCFCGRSDSIATPALAEALPRAVPGARMIRPRTGHVGMVVGSSARSSVWRPMAQFLVKQGC